MARAHFKCPHCGASSIVRTSYLVTDLIRESLHVCTNVLCGHTFMSLTEIVQTLSPSSMPRSDVCLPSYTNAELQVVKERIEGAGSQRRANASA